MKQADLGLNLTSKRTRKREFLDEMNRVVPWADLVALVAPFAPDGKKGRPPFAVETMLRLHFMQQWFGLSDPAMEEALHDVPLYREFAGLDNWTTRLPDESTILRFRHLLEKHKLAAQILALINNMLRDKGLMLRAGTVVDATLIAAPSSTKNAGGQRDPEMHQTKAPMRSRAWCTRSGAPRPTSTTWSKLTRCCTERRPTPSATPATRARTSERTRRRT
jgi:IS5 family transposase